MGIRTAFTAHPTAVGETYLEHLRHASGFARSLAKATVACTVHAFVPSMCERTASNAICDLHTRMTAGKRGDFVNNAVAECETGSIERADDPDIALVG